MNYLIDESVAAGKGANTVISLVHHYLDHHGLQERHAHFNADNCSGQNKNNAMMQVKHMMHTSKYYVQHELTQSKYSVIVIFYAVHDVEGTYWSP